MNIDFITQILLAGIATVAAAYFIVIGLKRFELAIIGVTISPFLAALFSMNSGESELTTSETIGSYIRIGLLFLMGLLGLIKWLQHRSVRFEKLPPPLKMLGAFLIFAVLSTSYSIDPSYTLIRSSSFVALFIFLIGLYEWLDEEQRFSRVIQSLFFVLICILAINAASIVFLGESAWWIKNPSRFSGVWGHPNTMGAFCMICYPIALWQLARIKSWHKLWALLFILVAAGLHLITGSRSSIVAGMLAVATWFFVTKQRIKPIVLSVLVAGIVMLLIETTPIEQSFERTVNRDKSVTTLTGRSDFWIESLELIKERPLLGYGFGTAGKILAESELFNPELRLWSGSAKTSLHNGYLTIASGIGVFGALIWVALLMVPLWQMRKLNPLPARAVIMAILLSCLLLNFVEDAINAGTSVPALIFWIAWTTAIRMERLETSKIGLPAERTTGLGQQEEQNAELTMAVDQT